MMPLLIQEKLDFYEWFYRQKEVILEYHAKCNLTKGMVTYLLIERCKKLRKKINRANPNYWYIIDDLGMGKSAWDNVGIVGAFIYSDIFYKEFPLSKYYVYSSGMTHPTAFRMQ